MGKPLLWKKFKTKGSAFIYSTANFDEQQGWDNAYKVMVNTMILMKKGLTEDVKL